VGRRPVLLVSLIGTAAGFVLMGLAQSLWLLFIARIIDGATGGNIATAQAYIAAVTPPEQRSKGMGLIGAAFGLGFIFGPALGGLLSHISLAAPFLFAGALAGANALAVYFLLPESLPLAQRGTVRRKTSFAELFQEAASRRALALVLAIYFITTVSFSLLTATYPLFTQRRFGFGAAQNGYVFAALGLVGAIVQGGLLGLLVKAVGDKWLTVAGTLALAGSMFLLPLGTSTVWLFAATAGLAVGHGLVAAPLNGMASRSVGAASQGRVLGLMQSMSSLARIVGPVLGGWLLQHDAMQMAASFGRTAYWASGALTLVAVVLAAML
jgi:DHA1 family tetracycline resistance protein-like MFS transporter